MLGAGVSEQLRALDLVVVGLGVISVSGNSLQAHPPSGRFLWPVARGVG